VSNLPEIKRRVDRLTELGNKMKDNVAGLKGAEGQRLKKKAKESGTRVGVGAGVSILGIMLACVAGLYVLAVIILAVNAALNKPWLSALIVVGGFLLIGGAIAAIGAGVAKGGAKDLSKATKDITDQMKQTSAEMKAEADELQKLMKAEAEQRQKQMKDMVEQAKAVAPVAAPAAALFLLFCRWMKKRRRNRKENKRILRVIELYQSKLGGEEAEE
jgi:membrane protein